MVTTGCGKQKKGRIKNGEEEQYWNVDTKTAR